MFRTIESPLKSWSGCPHLTDLQYIYKNFKITEMFFDVDDNWWRHRPCHVNSRIVLEVYEGNCNSISKQQHDVPSGMDDWFYKRGFVLSLRDYDQVRIYAGNWHKFGIRLEKEWRKCSMQSAKSRQNDGRLTAGRQYRNNTLLSLKTMTIIRIFVLQARGDRTQLSTL